MRARVEKECWGVRDQLELVTQKLLENETLDAAAFQQLIGISPTHHDELPRRSPDSAKVLTDGQNGQHSHAE